MEKLKIDIFSCLDGDICILFYRTSLLSSPLRFTDDTSFVQIAKSIRLPWQLEGNRVTVIRHVYGLSAYNF